MGCNGCRVLRKGCSDTYILRPCLQWIDSPEAQARATVFMAKFFGRAGLMAFIKAVPEVQRPALFQSLLSEACGRTVNPVFGAVGLLSSGNWSVCQAAVETVLRGGCLTSDTASSTLHANQRAETPVLSSFSGATQKCSNGMAPAIVVPEPSSKRHAMCDPLSIPLCWEPQAVPVSSFPFHKEAKLADKSDQDLHLDLVYGSIINPLDLSAAQEGEARTSKLVVPIPRRPRPDPRSVLMLQHQGQQEPMLRSDGIELDLTLNSSCNLGGIKLSHESTRVGSPSTTSEGSAMSFELSCGSPSPTTPVLSPGGNIAVKFPE